MGQIDPGRLAREQWGDRAVLIGFGRDPCTVTAARAWHGAPERMDVTASLRAS